MAFFSARRRPELGTDIGVEGKDRQSVRQDLAPPQCPRDEDGAGHLSLLMQRVAKTALQEIDELKAELGRRREKLLSESARVQREIIEYAKLSQSAMQSTKIISQRLSSLNKFPDASVKDISNEKQSESGTEASAQYSERTSADQGQPK